MTATTSTRNLIGTRDQWRKARLELLQAEKELTRQGDAVAAQRQALPWVPVDKEYSFDTEKGPASLSDLFGGRSQLLVYHFMFGPDYAAGCPSCSAIADGFNGIEPHLANHDVALWAVSRAPLPKLQAFRQRMGWTFPWASAFRSDFGSDFSAHFTEEQQWAGAIEYNYRQEPPMTEERAGKSVPSAAATETDLPTYTRERPGLSSFVLEDGVVYHAYSAYARGLDAVWGMYQWLDRAPKGRNEDGYWIRHRDAYGAR